MDIGTIGDRFPGRMIQIQRRQRLATAVTFLRSCVAQTLSRGDGPCQCPLVTRFGVCREYNEDLICEVLSSLINREKTCLQF